MKIDSKLKYWKALSHTARAVGDKGKALNYIRKGLELSPNNSDLLMSLGYTQWYFGNLDGAIEETEKALMFSSDEDEKEILKIKNNLAFYYAEKGTNEENALAYAKESYDRCPRESETFGYYADTYGYVKFKFAKKLEDIDEAIKLFLEAERAGISIDITIDRIRQAELKRKAMAPR